MTISQQDPITEHDLDQRITRALERSADVQVPENFAARVAASLPALKPRRSRAYIARRAALAAAVVLAAAMFVLAPHATPSFTSLAFDMEMLVIAQLAGVSWWLTRSRV